MRALNIFVISILLFSGPIYGVNSDSSFSYFLGYQAGYGRTLNNSNTDKWMAQNNLNTVRHSSADIDFFGGLLIKNYYLGLDLGLSFSSKNDFRIGYPLSLSIGRMVKNHTLKNKIIYGVDLGTENEIIKINDQAIRLYKSDFELGNNYIVTQQNLMVKPSVSFLRQFSFREDASKSKFYFLVKIAFKYTYPIQNWNVLRKEDTNLGYFTSLKSNKPSDLVDVIPNSDKFALMFNFGLMYLR